MADRASESLRSLGEALGYSGRALEVFVAGPDAPLVHAPAAVTEDRDEARLVEVLRSLGLSEAEARTGARGRDGGVRRRPAVPAAESGPAALLREFAAEWAELDAYWRKQGEDAYRDFLRRRAEAAARATSAAARPVRRQAKGEAARLVSESARPVSESVRLGLRLLSGEAIVAPARRRS